MVLPKLVLCQFAWILALVIFGLAVIVKSQTEICSIQDIDIGICLKQYQGSSFSLDHKCCKVLNEVAQTGYSCLCLLAAASIPLLNPPLHLPLSNCSILIPPLSLCPAVIAPLPVVLPPSNSDETIQPPMPPEDVMMSPPPSLPPTEKGFEQLNSTQDDSLTTAQKQPPLRGDALPILPPYKKCNDTSDGRGHMTQKMLRKTCFLPGFSFLWLCFISLIYRY